MASACLALSGAALALVPTSHVLPGQLSVRTRLAGSLMREATKDVPLTYSEYLAQKNGQAAEPAAAPFDEGVAQSPTVPMGNPPDFGKRLSQLEGGTDGVRRMLASLGSPLTAPFAINCSRAGAWNVYSAEAPAVVMKVTR